MEFGLESAQESFDTGHFSSVSQPAVEIGSLHRLQPLELRLLVAQAFVFTGRVKEAATLANSFPPSSTAIGLLAGAQIVLGLIKKREGQIEAASTSFRQAARYAKDAGDRRQLAWAQAHLFRLMADGHAETELTGLLAEARSSCAAAGDPHIVAYLHDSVAAMETRRGRTLEAQRHLRVARSLIALRPNAWLEQLVALNASCIAIVDCDPAAFTKFSSEARALARITGHVNSERAMETNDAYVALLGGHFEYAEALLGKILRSPATRHIELAALESVARMHLALGHLDKCEDALQKLEALKAQHLTLSYSFRTASAIKVRLLIRRGQFEQAVALADAELAQFATVNDLSSQAALMLLKATALARIGKEGACAKELLDANLLGATSFRGHQAESAQSCGMILARRSGHQANVFLERSFRIWREQGNQCGPVEALIAERGTEHDETAARDLLNSRSSRESLDMFRSLDPAIAINHLAAAFDVAYNPKLVGEELIRATRICNLSPNAHLSTSTKPNLNEAGFRNLVLGEAAGKHHVMTCAVPDDPLKAILLGDVMRIGRAALALERAREEERNRAALWPADPVEDQGDAVFLAEEMQKLLQTIRRIAPTTVPVLITGETGTGKEVLARTIHACSTRAKSVFLPFNCASTPKDMLDSQLFGHRRGAFTGAVEHFQGVVRAAAGGTLFLDEIGDTSLEVQPKLLRFLDSSEVHAVGEARPSKVDVRVIVATNADVDQMVADGRFREDLFYRLSIVRLHIPPLRERRVEIPSLANLYLRKHAREYGKGDLRLSEDTMEYLVLYKWPGNVRQLASEMRRLAALAESDAVLMPEHLSREIAASRRTIPASERTLESTEVVVRLDQPMAAATQHLERAMVQYALKKCGGRIEETAAMLGISRKGLYLKRLRFGIDPPGDPEVAALARVEESPGVRRGSNDVARANTPDA